MESMRLHFVVLMVAAVEVAEDGLRLRRRSSLGLLSKETTVC